MRKVWGKQWPSRCCLPGDGHPAFSLQILKPVQHARWCRFVCVLCRIAQPVPDHTVDPRKYKAVDAAKLPRCCQLTWSVG